MKSFKKGEDKRTGGIGYSGSESVSISSSRLITREEHGLSGTTHLREAVASGSSAALLMYSPEAFASIGIVSASSELNEGARYCCADVNGWNTIVSFSVSCSWVEEVGFWLNSETEACWGIVE